MVLAKNNEKTFLKNKKETIAYLFWGIAGSVLNIALYSLLVYTGINYQLANFVTLIIVKMFCFFTNKLFVFHSKSKGIREFLTEFIKFFVVRMMTFLMDYFGLILLVEKIGADKFVSKIFLTVLVIIVNYCMSKVFVFRSKCYEKERKKGRRDKKLVN